MKDKPCADCGLAYPYWVMQFDHVRGVKLANLNQLVTDTRSATLIEAEAAKCDVVCANCHAERTFSRMQAQERLPV